MLAIDLDIVPNRDAPAEEAGTASSGETPIKLDIVPALAEMEAGDAPVPVTAPEKPASPATETRASGLFTRRNLAFGFSLALHIGAAAALLTLRGQDVQIAGGAEEEVIIWGTDLVELAAAGAPAETIEPVTEPTTSEPVPLEPLEPVQETLQPVETANVAPEETPATPPAESAPVEPLQPVEPEPSPPEPIEQTPAETQPAQPEKILAAPATPEPSVTEPVPVPAEPIEPVEEAAPKEDMAAIAPVPRPTPRPDYQPPEVERKEAPAAEAKQRTTRPEEQPERKTEKTSPQKKTAKTGGSGGRDARDAKRGSSEGSRAAAGAASRGGGRASQAGNAAVSNYPGKIVSKLRRSLRYPREAQRQRLKGEVRVAFTVLSNGSVSGIRIVSSSGSPILDKAAVETVQRATPFPKIPEGAGRSSWPFTVPLAFVR